MMDDDDDDDKAVSTPNNNNNNSLTLFVRTTTKDHDLDHQDTRQYHNHWCHYVARKRVVVILCWLLLLALGLLLMGASTLDLFETCACDQWSRYCCHTDASGICRNNDNNNDNNNIPQCVCQEKTLLQENNANHDEFGGEGGDEYGYFCANPTKEPTRPISDEWFHAGQLAVWCCLLTFMGLLSCICCDVPEYYDEIVIVVDATKDNTVGVGVGVGVVEEATNDHQLDDNSDDKTIEDDPFTSDGKTQTHQFTTTSTTTITSHEYTRCFPTHHHVGCGGSVSWIAFFVVGLTLCLVTTTSLLSSNDNNDWLESCHCDDRWSLFACCHEDVDFCGLGRCKCQHKLEFHPGPPFCADKSRQPSNMATLLLVGLDGLLGMTGILVVAGIVCLIGWHVFCGYSFHHDATSQEKHSGAVGGVMEMTEMKHFETMSPSTSRIKRPKRSKDKAHSYHVINREDEHDNAMSIIVETDQNPKEVAVAAGRMPKMIHADNSTIRTKRGTPSPERLAYQQVNTIDNDHIGHDDKALETEMADIGHTYGPDKKKSGNWLGRVRAAYHQINNADHDNDRFNDEHDENIHVNETERNPGMV